MSSIMYERDLLYPTENVYEPGSVHVKVLNPTSRGKIPVIVESRTQHSVIKHLDAVVRIMQTDIFDRILVDIKKNVSLYIEPGESDSGELKGKRYFYVKFEGDNTEYKAVDALEFFH